MLTIDPWKTKFRGQLNILDAMGATGGGKLIGIDPAQHDGTWRGGGLHNLRRAGFIDQYEFHEEPSQAVLPRLVAANNRIQFAFIDGWHTFDHTLVDFFYIDKMLDVGGVIVLDDVGYPSLRTLAHFVVTNRDYTLLDLDPLPFCQSLRSSAKKAVQRVLHPFVRDNFTPSIEMRRLQEPVDRAQLIALRKHGEDRRPFDHFVAF